MEPVGRQHSSTYYATVARLLSAAQAHAADEQRRYRDCRALIEQEIAVVKKELGVLDDIKVAARAARLQGMLPDINAARICRDARARREALRPRLHQLGMELLTLHEQHVRVWSCHRSLVEQLEATVRPRDGQ